MNRSQDRVATILAKSYNPPMLVELPVTLTSEADYSIPEDALEQRLLKVDFRAGPGASWQRLDEVSIRDLDRYESTQPGAVGAPLWYCIIGDTYRLLPGAPGTGSLRVFYLANPAPLVLEQGRLTLVNTSGNYVIVDELGDDVSTDSDELESYVNVVDKDSGRIKATLQVQAIADRKVTFRAAPTRTTVQGRAVVGALPQDIEPDDYLCNVAGTCVPLMKKPASNYLVQYAAADIAVTKLGADPGILLGQVRLVEEDVEKSWSGRPNILRVRNRSNTFTRGRWGARYG